MGFKDELEQYEGYKYKFINKYKIPGLDKEDLEQVIDLAIWEAVKKYKKNRGSSKNTFVWQVIKRRVINELIKATTNKAEFNNSAVSLDKDRSIKDDDIEINLYNLLPDSRNTERDVIIRFELNRFLSTLSKLEKRVLVKRLQGYEYHEIADIYDSNLKSVDNAVQRARRKAIKSPLKEMIM